MCFICNSWLLCSKRYAPLPFLPFWIVASLTHRIKIGHCTGQCLLKLYHFLCVESLSYLNIYCSCLCFLSHIQSVWSVPSKKILIDCIIWNPICLLLIDDNEKCNMNFSVLSWEVWITHNTWTLKVRN